MQVSKYEAEVLEGYVEANYDSDQIEHLTILDIERIQNNRYAIYFSDSNLVVLTPHLLIPDPEKIQ